MATPEFVSASILEARKSAQRVFRGRSDCEEMVAEATSYAWEFARNAGPTATPKQVAKFVLKRLRSSRLRGGSVRSIDHPRNRVRHERESTDASTLDLHRPGDDPALIVQVRLDFVGWLLSLSRRNQRIAMMMARGYATYEIADLFGMSRGRVSQLRRELMESWQEFTE